MSGRISARFLPAGMSVDGRRVELLTGRPRGEHAESAPAIHVAPIDFHLDWQQPTGSTSVRGNATASVLDLAAFAGLATHLPLAAGARQLLSDLAPRGRIDELRAAWDGNSDGLQTYSLKARFEDLALRPLSLIHI